MKSKFINASILILAIFVMIVGNGGALFAKGKQEEMAPFSDRYRDMSWDEITAEAEGQEVFWYMWGGSDTINNFVQGYVANRLQDEYGIRLTMVPITDASLAVSKVLDEKQAGRLDDGSVDLIWINGENFRAMREAELLFGPYSDLLPNMQYVDAEAPSFVNDFGYPVEGYESPYGSAQMVMIYDSARVPTPPKTIDDLFAWIRNNPGKFTYPAPPDFTGSAFVRHIYYHAAGDVDRLLGPFDAAVHDEVSTRAWELLTGIGPYLWREGNTYPESRTLMIELFANGEVFFDMAYNPSEAASLVMLGRYPETTRTFVFDSGTIGNVHFVAIPFNSSKKAAAMVTANLLLDPEVQLEKLKPEVWGDHTVLALDTLSAELRSQFENLTQHPSVLSAQELSDHRLSELQADWLQAIERDWQQNILFQ